MDGLRRTIAFKKTLLLAAVLVNATLATLSAQAAEVIQFPDDELASESVLPVFDQTVSVKNKAVLTRKRFELGPIAGLALMEPFYNPLNYGLTASYHFTEEHGLNFMGVMYLEGLSNNAKGLNPIPRTNPPIYANLQYAPSPKWLFLTNYQYSAFYGKISITKDFVMNLNLYGIAGAGAIGVGDTVKPVLNFGLGQKFHITPSFALRADLRFFFYQGPDVLSRPLDNEKAVVSASTMGETLNYGTLLTAGAVFLFPGM